MPEPMPHSLREKLLAVRTALSEYQAGNRNALFDSRARLRELEDEVALRSGAGTAGVCAVVQKLVNLILRQGQVEEHQAVELAGELLAAVDAVTAAGGPVERGAAPAPPRVLHDRQELSRLGRGGAARASAPRGNLAAPSGPPAAPGAPTHVQLNADLVDETRLGEILLQTGVIDEDGLTRALGLQQVCRRRLGDVLVTMGLIDELRLREALDLQRYATLRMAKGQVSPLGAGFELRVARPDIVEEQRSRVAREG